MSLRPLTSIAAGETIEADVAIVGAGAAGLSLSTALAAAGIDVALLETGSLGAPREDAGVDAAPVGREEANGSFRRDLRFGGTLWYGRTVLPDAVDFESRPWVKASGWPIPYREIEAHLDSAARWLGIAQPRALDASFWRREPAWRLLDGGGLAPRVHLISRDRDLGARYRRATTRSERIAAFLGATLVGLELEPHGRRIVRARVAGEDGRERAVRARRFVIACGGLENARQLLLLDEASPGALATSAASLGHGFFDHPRCDGVARLRLRTRTREGSVLYRRLVEHASARAGCRVQLAVGLSPERQRVEGLLNPCGFFYPVSTPRLADLGGVGRELATQLAAGRLRRADLERARALLGGSHLVLGALAARARRRPYRLAYSALVEQLEQTRAEAGRVELAAERDRFGRRRLRVHWRVGEETRRTQRRFHQLLAARFAATGAGELESPLLADPEHLPSYFDAAHPMGATRMSQDPAEGVVDGDLRVHALDNLFVVGSSVFPTSGNANPTLTIVALALRLAAHLATTSIGAA